MREENKPKAPDKLDGCMQLIVVIVSIIAMIICFTALI
jgi:hypothetical protein